MQDDNILTTLVMRASGELPDILGPYDGSFEMLMMSQRWCGSITGISALFNSTTFDAPVKVMVSTSTQTDVQDIRTHIHTVHDFAKDDPQNPDSIAEKFTPEKK